MSSQKIKYGDKEVDKEKCYSSKKSYFVRLAQSGLERSTRFGRGGCFIELGARVG